MLTRGQIWVETVLYTLIGIALMGLVLAFALPKITAAQERAVVEQSIQSMQLLSETLSSVETRGVGNVKVISFALGAGEMVLNGLTDTVVLTLPEQKSTYSQPGSPIAHGSVNVLTEERGGFYRVTLTLTPPHTNLTISGQDKLATLTPVRTSYRIAVRALDVQPGKTVISLETS